MKRKILSSLFCFCLLLTLSACGSKATETTTKNNEQKTEKLSKGLPPLPEFVKSKGKLVVGVKADYPPFGFMNEKGEHDGFDINLAKKIAEYAFGDPNSIEYVSVTSANRIPFLTSKKVDLLIATIGVTEERKKEIDFSKAYYNASNLFLVPKESEIKGLDDIKGKNVITIKGTLGSIALEKMVPSANQLKFDNTSEGVRALKSGRGVALVQDDILLYDIAKNNPDLKIVGEPFEFGLMAIGTRKGEEEWLNWLNAAIDKAAQEDLFYKWFKNWYPDMENVPKYLPRAK